MSPSAEYLALKALRQPPRSIPGDMWVCRRMGIVKLMLGHHRTTKRGCIPTDVFVYHWEKRCLRVRPADLRDDDPNACVGDPAIERLVLQEKWEYVGNLFEMLPYDRLVHATGTP